MKKTMFDVGKPMARRVQVRLSDKDYLKLNRAATKQGVSLATFLRNAGKAAV